VTAAGRNGMGEPGAHGRILDIPRLLLPSPGGSPTGASNRRTRRILVKGAHLSAGFFFSYRRRAARTWPFLAPRVTVTESGGF
jgi:hypothetical protein